MSSHKLKEEDLVASGHGKWSQAGVPHRGWTCIEIEDLGSPDRICEMCETSSIRFVHYMEHPKYQETLAVGCVCAGHMEEDLAASHARETTMRNRASRRKRWLTRIWRVSAKGNDYLRADGLIITVYRRSWGWASTVAKADNSLVHHSRRNYKTQDEAKLAAFDLITHQLI